MVDYSRVERRAKSYMSQSSVVYTLDRMTLSLKINPVTIRLSIKIPFEGIF